MSNMSLPAGKTCRDCVHYSRCEWLISCDAASTACDWRKQLQAAIPDAQLQMSEQVNQD